MANLIDLKPQIEYKAQIKANRHRDKQKMCKPDNDK